jgi:hypothetical protein
MIGIYPAQVMAQKITLLYSKTTHVPNANSKQLNTNNVIPEGKQLVDFCKQYKFERQCLLY